MKKLVLIFSTLILSTNVLASNGAHSLSSAMMNAMQSHAGHNVPKNFLPLVYGGKDISRLATADESIWSGQHTLIG